MYRTAAVPANLSRDQFDAARLGFDQLLRRKRMSPSFIERHGEDLFAQACFEYTRRGSEVEIENPPAWIVTCAWHRTVSLLETRDYRPQLVSTDSVAEPVDRTPGPEDVLLDEDRARKIREAVAELPLYQRHLMALSYFEGESVREAARRLGWTASKAQRAHESAQRRIRKLLDIDSLDDLEVPIGLFAFLSYCADRLSPHVLPAGSEAVLDSARRGVSELGHAAASTLHRPLAALGGGHRPEGRVATGAIEATDAGRRGALARLGDLGRRLTLGGAGEGGAAMAGEGGSRVAELCKGLAVCAIGGGVLTTTLVGGGPRPSPHPAPQRSTAVKVGRPRPHLAASRRVTGGTVTVSAPRPRDTSGGGRTSESTGHRETGADAPRIASAAPVAKSGVAVEEAHASEAEASVEDQFQNFDATEGSAGGSPAATGRTVTDSATTSPSPSTSSSGGGSTSKHAAEEAQTAKQFQGPLGE